MPECLKQKEVTQRDKVNGIILCLPRIQEVTMRPVLMPQFSCIQCPEHLVRSTRDCSRYAGDIKVVQQQMPREFAKGILGSLEDA